MSLPTSFDASDFPRACSANELISVLQTSRLEITHTTSPKPVPASSTLVFGQTFTDHMLTIKWSKANGWAAPKIEPYGPLALDPSSTVLHYAPTLFEVSGSFLSADWACTMRSTES